MKTKREPTPEQKAAAAERRERFKGFVKQVAAMNEDERARVADRIGGIVTTEGRLLSHFNTCLLIAQGCRSPVVGGFWQWKVQGRKVRKGEHGLSIWIPTKGKKADAPEPTDATAEDGETKRGCGFIMGTVFGSDQTEPAA